jgi:6-phosphogluconolactonase
MGVDVVSRRIVLNLFLAALVSQISIGAPKQMKFILYVGTYGKGVYGYRFNSDTGDLQPLGLLAEITNPSWLTTDSSYRNLYAASELDGNVNGNVGAFTIDRTSAKLNPLNTRSSDGVAPCHVSVDATGKMVFAANYTSGQLAVFPTGPDGSLREPQVIAAHGSSVNKERQEGPHAHEAVVSPDNRFLYVPDLGLDQIHIYKIDTAAEKVTPNDPPFVKLSPGNGPRHMALTKDGKFAYVVNELKPVVTVFTRDPSSGVLTQVQEVSLLAEGYKGESGPAEILLDHAGRFVYASNRGPGTITVFAVTPGTGTLKQIQVAETGGTWPRGVEFDPSGKLLFAGDQKANNFVLFDVDAQSGKLHLSGKKFEVPSPVSFAFVPAS